MRYNNVSVNFSIARTRKFNKKKSNNKIDFKNEFWIYRKLKILSMINLMKNYLLKDIELEIKKSKNWSFLTKGVGKSTILDFITGLINPEADEIILDGKI